MISSFLFDNFESKPIVLIDVPFCNKNEKVSKQLFEKLKTSTKVKYDFTTVWKTKKVRLLSLKEKNTYLSCKTYEALCSCKENYTGETRRNIVTRWNGHENPNKDSKPAKHLFQYHDHVFQWKVLMSAPMNNWKRKSLDAFFIAVRHLTLNEQKYSNKLTLFRIEVTWCIWKCFSYLSVLRANAQWWALLQYGCLTNLIGANSSCWTFSLKTCGSVRRTIFFQEWTLRLLLAMELHNCSF